MVDLLLIPPAALEALARDDLDAARAILGVDLPEWLRDDNWLWRLRSEDIRQQPTSAPWLVRLCLRRSDGVVVGHAGFHGPPDAERMVEVAYTVGAPHRGHGYGKAALAELMAFAAASGQVDWLRASTSPDNDASIAILRSAGFEAAGEQWDDVDGLELVFRRPVLEVPAGP